MKEIKVFSGEIKNVFGGEINQEEAINENILKRKAHEIQKNYQMKEDMFSMLFVEALRPEYRYYCDLISGNQPQK